MHHYELVVVLSPMLNQDQVSDTWGRIKNFINNRNGDITYEERWGTRRLAYPIRKGSHQFLEGSYHLTRFNADTSFNNELNTFLRLDEQVLRSLVVATQAPGVEPETPIQVREVAAQAAAARAAAAAEAAAAEAARAAEAAAAEPEAADGVEESEESGVTEPEASAEEQPADEAGAVDEEPTDALAEPSAEEEAAEAADAEPAAESVAENSAEEEATTEEQADAVVQEAPVEQPRDEETQEPDDAAEAERQGS